MLPSMRHSNHHIHALLVLLWVLWQRSVLARTLYGSSVLQTTQSIQVAPSIAAVLAIAIGTFVCFYGYRVFRLVVFVCAFIAGGLVVAIVIEYVFARMAWMPTASWIGFLTGGAVVGMFAVVLYSVGVFLVGALAGILLAFSVMTSFAYRILPSYPDVLLVILVVILGVSCGLLAWKVERSVLIVATSFIGATALVWGAGSFLGKYPSGADLKRFRTKGAGNQWIYAIPTAWWGYLAATILFFLLGVTVQFRRTARGISHTAPRAQPQTDSLSSRRLRHGSASYSA
ncbi:hypothetical protein PINS_up005524 [Pythium insidiosum]|nr:hypothetical protein PINS_up005524 [Pythium insidiosum]